MLKSPHAWRRRTKMTSACRNICAVGLALLFACPPALAQQAAVSAAPSEPKAVTSDLDAEKARKETEATEFLSDKRYRKIIKAHSLEIAPFIGPFLGDALPNSIVYGGRTAYHVTERFAVGVDGGFTEAGFEPFTLGTVISQGDRQAYFIVGNITYHIPNVILPVPEKIIQSDLFVTTGGGIFHSLGNDEPTFNIGGGAKIYFAKYFILRVDVRNFIVEAHPPISYKNKITSNAMIMIGLSFFLPTRSSDDLASPHS